MEYGIALPLDCILTPTVITSGNELQFSHLAGLYAEIFPRGGANLGYGQKRGGGGRKLM